VKRRQFSKGKAPTVIENAFASLDQLDKASAALRADLEQLRVLEQRLAETADKPAAPLAAVGSQTGIETSTFDARDEPAAAGGEPDNSFPFKCPACGATYAEQVTCTNQHPAEQTLPTADVLAGAQPTPADVVPVEPVPPTAAPSPSTSSADSSASGSTASAPAAAEPTTPAGPPWPA
jgi:hypothetical protein